MNADQLLALLDQLSAMGIAPWVDGGWGVDALLGRQTRDHNDVDLVVPAGNVPAVRAMLEDDGYRVIRDWLPTAVAFEHDDGRSVDLHPIEPTRDGGGDQIQLDGSRWHYDAPATGVIDGREVVCVSLESQLRAHTGYEPDGTDFRDMRALHEAFGCELPDLYRSNGGSVLRGIPDKA